VIREPNTGRGHPGRQSHTFRHIRFFDYCRRLLDLESSAQGFIGDFRREDYFKHFGEKLDQIQKRSRSKADSEAKWSETAESGRERERSVAKAAYRFAEAHEGRTIEDWLYSLKGRRC
jgi:hypothetical protein